MEFSSDIRIISASLYFEPSLYHQPLSLSLLESLFSKCVSLFSLLLLLSPVPSLATHVVTTVITKAWTITTTATGTPALMAITGRVGDNGVIPTGMSALTAHLANGITMLMTSLASEI